MYTIVNSLFCQIYFLCELMNQSDVSFLHYNIFLIYVCNQGNAGKNMLHHQYYKHKFLLPEWMPVFMCEICGLALRTKSKLQDHINSHDSTRSFLCSKCGYSARTKVINNFNFKANYFFIILYKRNRQIVITFN